MTMPACDRLDVAEPVLVNAGRTPWGQAAGRTCSPVCHLCPAPSRRIRLLITVPTPERGQAVSWGP